MARFRHAVLAAAVVAVVAGGPSSVTVDGQGAVPPVLLVVNSAGANPFGGYSRDPAGRRHQHLRRRAAVGDRRPDTGRPPRSWFWPKRRSRRRRPRSSATYVAGGGRLVAMRPDPQLAGVLGIGFAGGTVATATLLVDQSGPGAGLQNR